MNKNKLNITWLASYPRSGNTWVRHLFGAYALGQETDWKVSSNGFVGLHGLLSAKKGGAAKKEEAKGRKKRALINAQKIRDRFPPSDYQIKGVAFKTHFKWSEKHPWHNKTNRVIRLIRHPKDVLVSCLNFEKAMGREIESDHEWVRQFIKNGGVPHYISKRGTWLEHYQSWSKVEHPVHLVRYEDIKRDTLAEFVRMLEFLEIPVDESRARFATEQASFESMRKKEDELANRRVKARRILEGHNLVRSGTTNQSLAQFNVENEECLDEYFNSTCSSALQLTGYE